MKNKAGITLIELLVVFSILWILWSIWFMQYSEYLKISRDSIRKSDLLAIEVALLMYKKDNLILPTPSENKQIKSGGDFIWNQWLFSEKIAKKINLWWTPKDPKTWNEYLYSNNKITWEVGLLAYRETKPENTREASKYPQLWEKNQFITFIWKWFMIFESNNLPLSSEIDLSQINEFSNYIWINNSKTLQAIDVKYIWEPLKSCQHAYANWIIYKSWTLALQNNDFWEYYVECLIENYIGRTKVANIDSTNNYHTRPNALKTNNIYDNSSSFWKFWDEQINQFSDLEFRLECNGKVNYFKTTQFDADDISLNMEWKENFGDAYESITRMNPNQLGFDWTKITGVVNPIIYGTKAAWLNWCYESWNRAYSWKLYVK